MAERRSFVVRADPSGRSTVEDVRTGTSVAVAALADVGWQIEAWLAPDVQGQDRQQRGLLGGQQGQ